MWASAPETRWLFASYAQELAIRDSRSCRRLLESDWYRARWGHRFFTWNYRLTTRFLYLDRGMMPLVGQRFALAKVQTYLRREAVAQCRQHHMVLSLAFTEDDQLHVLLQERGGNLTQ